MHGRTSRQLIGDPRFQQAKVYRPRVDMNRSAWYAKARVDDWDYPLDYEELPLATVFADDVNNIYRLLQVELWHSLSDREKRAVVWISRPHRSMTVGDVVELTYEDGVRRYLLTLDRWRHLGDTAKPQDTPKRKFFRWFSTRVA